MLKMWLARSWQALVLVLVSWQVTEGQNIRARRAGYLSFRQLMQMTLMHIQRRRLLVPVPFLPCRAVHRLWVF